MAQLCQLAKNLAVSSQALVGDHRAPGRWTVADWAATSCRTASRSRTRRPDRDDDRQLRDLRGVASVPTLKFVLRVALIMMSSVSLTHENGCQSLFQASMYRSTADGLAGE